MSSDPYAPPSSPARSTTASVRFVDSHPLALGIWSLLGASVVLNWLFLLVVAIATYRPYSAARDWYAAAFFVGRIGALATGLGAIAFLIWQYLVARNSNALGYIMSMSPLATVLLWLMPPANLVVPYQTMSEIWTNARRGSSAGCTPIVLGWWVSFLANCVLSVASGRVPLKSEEYLVVWLGVLSVRTAAFALLLIMTRQIVRGQRAISMEA